VSKSLSLRDDYGYFLAIPTRWMDNDIYGHINNVTYYSYFDTVVARFLLGSGAINLVDSEVIGVVVETQCRFHAPIASIARRSGAPHPCPKNFAALQPR